jgi:hypothetical protein
MALLLSACTPTVHRLQPYRSDPTEAEKLQLRAQEYCSQFGGEMPPHPFTTDGCSMWPDDRWVQCCVEHDLDYWCGGSSDDRKRADAGLRQCVGADSGAFMGWMMYWGVRAGGVAWMPFPWRWAYGWDCCRGYQEHLRPQP